MVPQIHSGQIIVVTGALKGIGAEISYTLGALELKLSCLLAMPMRSKLS